MPHPLTVELSPDSPNPSTPELASPQPIDHTPAATASRPPRKSDSGSNSLNSSSKEESGGAGNESDDEREASDDRMSGEQTRDDSDEQVPSRLRPHHEMYPFPSIPHHHREQRHSSAEVEASSAGSSSSVGMSDFDDDDDDEDQPMEDDKVVRLPQRSLSEYRASLSRVGLAAPPKIRRIGALGISVHSDSDVENPQVSGIDTNDRIDLGSGGDSSNATRETDLGVSLAALQAGTGSGSQSGSGKGLKGTRRRRRGIADATFRGIVDELAVENRHLKDQLRRYEAHGVPVELKESRLFEIRFFDGLPIDKRTELERFLTHYVQDFVEKGPAPSSPPSQATNSRSMSKLPTPQVSSEHIASPPSLSSPQESDRSERRLGKQGRELAEASNSGVEPPSISGIGSGVYRPNGFFPSQPFESLGVPGRPPLPAIATNDDQELAKSVVSSLEQLFRHSMMQNKEEEKGPDDPPAERSRSNETYMANFLSHDFLSDGWVYLNLASTMAELHRYSVTLNFVQQAVRDYSSQLEVSEDGKRIRWIGASPTPSQAQLSDEVDPDTFAKPRRPSDKIPSPAPTDSQVSSGQTTVTDGSRSSSNPSSRDAGSNLLANSIAQTASTAPTSQAPASIVSKQRSTKQTRTATRPQRPTAAVLQRMDRLSPPMKETSTSPQRGGGRQASTHVAKQSSPKDRLPQSAVSFVSHPTSAMRQPPSIFHRLFRNQLEEEFALDSKDNPFQPPKGPGMLVFYSNGHFCSDLSQEDPVPQTVEDLDARFVLGAQQEKALFDEGSPELCPMSIDLDDDVDLLTFDLDLANESGDEGGSSVDSHASSLQRLKASGMSNTIPADLFTILVKTEHARKRHRRDSSALDSPAKKRRTAGPPSKILSSKAVYHRPLIARRLAPVHLGDGMAADSPRFHLTTSNLAKHTQPNRSPITPPSDDPPTLPREGYHDTPSPPHDDYLLSLSAPLHAWAPREYNSVSQSYPVPPQPIAKTPAPIRRKFAKMTPARSLSELTTTTTTGDERPISLDDPVAPGAFR